MPGNRIDTGNVATRQTPQKRVTLMNSFNTACRPRSIRFTGQMSAQRRRARRWIAPDTKERTGESGSSNSAVPPSPE
jgi:hypothetical protein